MIVPKKPLNLLKGTLPMTDEVVVSFNEANAHFKYGEMDLVCRLIEGKYPNYEAVIPKENPNCMTIDRKDFQRSIRRVSIFANKTTHQVRLVIGREQPQNQRGGRGFRQRGPRDFGVQLRR